MRGVDTAAIVINAHSGIEVNTRRVFAEAKKAGLGRIIVINNMDADNIDFPELIDEHPGAVRHGLRAAERAAGPRQPTSAAWPARSSRPPTPPAP